MTLTDVSAKCNPWPTVLVLICGSCRVGTGRFSLIYGSDRVVMLSSLNI
jgi:hypothetical protein